MSECTPEEIFSEGLNSCKINTLMRSFPKTKPSNSNLVRDCILNFLMNFSFLKNFIKLRFI